MERTVIIDALKRTDFGQKICVKGWVRSRRGNKNVSFIALNDGSTIKNVQIVGAMAYSLLKNGQPSTAKQIRIEKRYVVGYSITDQITPGDEFTLCIRKYLTDSRNFPLRNLFEDAIAAISAHE